MLKVLLLEPVLLERLALMVLETVVEEEVVLMVVALLEQLGERAELREVGEAVAVVDVLIMVVSEV